MNLSATYERLLSDYEAYVNSASLPSPSATDILVAPCRFVVVGLDSLHSILLAIEGGHLFGFVW